MDMKKTFLFFSLVQLVFIPAATARTGPVKLAFWNVENLFDLVDDPRTRDNDYLIGGKKNVTSESYSLKLENLSEVIDQISPDAIVDYSQFNITNTTGNETVNFNQADATYRILNRINIGAPGATSLNGAINAVGTVIFTNEAGVIFGANAVIDVGALRRQRRRLGMANILSRQAYGLFAESYAEADFHRGNFLMEDGEVVEPPDREIFRRRQADNIERLIKAGLL